MRRLRLPSPPPALLSVTVEPTWAHGERDEHAFEARRMSGALVAGPDGLRVDGLVASIDRGIVRHTLSNRDSAARSGHTLTGAARSDGWGYLPVCFATHVVKTNGFLEVPENSLVTVSRSLQVNVTPMGNHH